MEWTGSDAGLALALRLSQLRSAVRVGLALATACPTEESWEAMMSKPEIHETFSEFATIVDDILADVSRHPPDAALTQVMAHHARGLEALELFAEAMTIDPEDLLVILTA